MLPRVLHFIAQVVSPRAAYISILGHFLTCCGRVGSGGIDRRDCPRMYTCHTVLHRIIRITSNVDAAVKPEWNIKITLVEPGAFSTAVVKTNSHVGAKQTPAYDHLKSEDIRKAFNEVWSINGDVSKAGARIYELAKMEDPPLRVVLGSDAVGLMKDKLEKYTSEVRNRGLFYSWSLSQLSSCRFRNGKSSRDRQISRSEEVRPSLYVLRCTCHFESGCKLEMDMARVMFLTMANSPWIDVLLSVLLPPAPELPRTTPTLHITHM